MATVVVMAIVAVVWSVVTVTVGLSNIMVGIVLAVVVVW